MRALQVNRLSEDLSGVAINDALEPIAVSGMVVIRVFAASLDFPDC